MLEYKRIYASVGININATGDMCECIFCHYWHFFRINYRFQTCVWDGCHDLLQKSIDFDDAAVVTVRENAHRFILWGMTKAQTMSKIKNPDLRGKSGHL